MAKLFSYLLILLIMIPFNTSAQEQKWYFPIQDFESRNQYKTFNQYIDKSFYKGREALFPTQYTGYHVADDLEINSGEENQNIPIYAVSDGKITFTGSVSGYGGVILLNIDNDSHTALYGHVRLGSLKVKAGDSVKAGQELAYLGNGFSNETGGERKHLHFGIYNGKGIYYRGYESSEATVQSKWIDPAAYLKQKGAVEPNAQPSDVSYQQQNNDKVVQSNDTAARQVGSETTEQMKNQGILSSIIRYLGNISGKVKSAARIIAR